MDPKITYFPVGNGDCSLITLSDNCQIMIDCNFTEDSKDEDEPGRYNVHEHLLKFGKKLDGKIPHVDVFILTHSDQDHCRGFDTTFYTGDPAKYGDGHLKKGLLLIDEIWFTRRIFSPHEGELSVWAEAFRKEAKRRIALHKAGSADGDKPGNRVRIIGYSDNPDYKGLEHLVTGPGKYIDIIDGKRKTDFRFFVHAPFKLETDAHWSERNDTSVVLQATFDVGQTKGAGIAMFGGDAGAGIWSKILELSSDETLQWDLFLAPHHCSWGFFSDQPFKDNKVAAENSLTILGKGLAGAAVIASCKPIKDDDDNPPHYAAMEEYVDVVGADKLYSLSERPNEDQPLPTTFEISANGPVLIDTKTAGVIASSAAIQRVAKTPQTYGR